MKKKLPKILIVDDQSAIRRALKNLLGLEGYSFMEASDGREGLELIKEEDFACVLCDIKMPIMDGQTLLREALDLKPNIPFIMISGNSDYATAVECVREGALDFMGKPPDPNRLIQSVNKAVSGNVDDSANKSTKKKAKKSTSDTTENQIVGTSSEIVKLLDMVDRVAATDARVLILGPNGSGKELIASRVHQNSSRSKKQMVTVNCAAIPSELIESELFGHEKGSFTSAVKQHIGKFEQANGSTLFLDEIGDMSLTAQAKVLRVLQEGIVSRIGGNKDIAVDVRVVAATNKNLKEEIKRGNFREDLYHRLSVVTLNIPSLNERREDIPLLVEHFMAIQCAQYDKKELEIDDMAMKMLMAHDWTGNIRQLGNTVERLVIFCDKVISINDVTMFL